MNDHLRFEAEIISADYVKALLDGQEIYALAHLYLTWAHAEASLDLDQKEDLLDKARAYRAIADSCGNDWKATKPNDPPQLLKFIADLAIENMGNVCGSDHLFEPGYPDVDTFLALLAAKTVEILKISDDPVTLRAELLQRAESAGYWHYLNGIRQQTPELFALDFLEHNPIAALWAREARWWIYPDAIQEEYQLLDACDPVPFGCNSI